MYIILYCQGYGPILHTLQRVYYQEDKQCYNEEDKSMVKTEAQYYQYNVFYQKEEKPMVRTVTLMFHTVVYQLVHCVLSKGGQILVKGECPNMY